MCVVVSSKLVNIQLSTLINLMEYVRTIRNTLTGGQGMENIFNFSYCDENTGGNFGKFFLFVMFSEQTMFDFNLNEPSFTYTHTSPNDRFELDLLLVLSQLSPKKKTLILMLTAM